MHSHALNPLTRHRVVRRRFKVVPGKDVDAHLLLLHSDARLERPSVFHTWNEPMCLVAYEEWITPPTTDAPSPSDAGAPPADTSPSPGTGIPAPLSPLSNAGSMCDTPASPASEICSANPLLPPLPKVSPKNESLTDSSGESAHGAGETQG